MSTPRPADETAMSDTQTAWWLESRDKYGRRVRHLMCTGHATLGAGVTLLGAVVTLPHRTASGRTRVRYLVNDWTAALDAPGKVTYWWTLHAAKAHLEQVTR